MENKLVYYYTILEAIKFSDGFEVKAGQKVMLLKEEDAGKWLNVQLDLRDEKRIFWIENSNVKLHSMKKEKWPKSKVVQHEIDINEKWLENEGKNTRASRAAGISTKSKRSKGNNGPTGGSRKKISKTRTRKTVPEKTGRKRVAETPAKKTKTTGRAKTKVVKRTKKTK